nr:archaetidylserine decarboxylase [Paenibacillus hamazuiensis]
MKSQHFLRLLTELTSYKWSSRLIGSFTKTKTSRLLIPWYSKTYAICNEEAEKPVSAYRSLNDFFTRRLKSGLRPVDPYTASLVSPVDATVTEIGRIHDNLSIRVKGQEYKVGELLGRSIIPGNFNGGFFIILYLSPADYHRIHSPVSGFIRETAHIPGKAYPVNEFGLKHMRKVLKRNERLITYMQHRYGILSIVKVGAMNVCSIKYTEPLSLRLNKGDEFAYFEFGSTIILLMENEPFEFRSGLGLGSRVRVGEPLGYWVAQMN